MSHLALIFGMRVALFLLAVAVICAFSRPLRTWARSNCIDIGNAERLAAGVCFLGIGSIFSGVSNMTTLLFGPGLLEDYISAAMASIIGIALLQVGYFLCFTAWLSENRSIPIRRVALKCFLAVVAISGIGAAAFYAVA